MQNNMNTMMQAMRNPQAFLQQAMNNHSMMQNPMFRNAIEMYQRGDSKGLQNMAENLAKERGTSVNDIKNSIMQQFGMK